MGSLKTISWIIVAKSQISIFLKKHKSVIRQLVIWLVSVLVSATVFFCIDYGIGFIILCGFWAGWEAAKENGFLYSKLEFSFNLVAGIFIFLLVAILGDFQSLLLTFLICAFFYSLSYIFSYYIWLDFEKIWERLGAQSAIENLDFNCGEEFD